MINEAVAQFLEISNNYPPTLWCYDKVGQTVIHLRPNFTQYQKEELWSIDCRLLGSGWVSYLT